MFRPPPPSPPLHRGCWNLGPVAEAAESRRGRAGSTTQVSKGPDWDLLLSLPQEVDACSRHGLAGTPLSSGSGRIRAGVCLLSDLNHPAVLRAHSWWLLGNSVWWRELYANCPPLCPFVSSLSPLHHLSPFSLLPLFSPTFLSLHPCCPFSTQWQGLIRPPPALEPGGMGILGDIPSPRLSPIVRSGEAV